MNFLLRSSSHHVAPEKVSAHEPAVDAQYMARPTKTLEGLVTEDPFPESPVARNRQGGPDEVGDENGSDVGSASKKGSCVVEGHSDVSEEEGWITIPHKELPDEWNSSPNIQSLRSLDRSFVFPGEQVHILACLSASDQDTETITPFKVAAVMCKNGIGQSPERQNGNMNDRSHAEGETSAGEQVTKSEEGDDSSVQKSDPKVDVSASESILRMEDHKRQTETLLQRFKNSHFFVRIAESDEPLWSKKAGQNRDLADIDGQSSIGSGTGKAKTHLNALIDKGNFDANVAGGAARNSVNCWSLSNGDIVVLLQVNVGTHILRDPVIEILQFEKYQMRNLCPEKPDAQNFPNADPYGQLLTWLLPLDNTLPPPPRNLSPPQRAPIPVLAPTSQKPVSSGSQLFSHFRSYSMSSLPQNSIPPPQPVKAQSSKPNFDIDEWGEYSSQKLRQNRQKDGDGLLSFRGVSLERERFSVRCGLEGMYIPGKRWRRKLEIIQPVEIHSFAADCNTDDLLCVQIKNISPAHLPDIVVYIDAITMVFNEASKDGMPLSLPIACIEAGDDHCLPNLALRRGEEHAFILKPASSMWKNPKGLGEKTSFSANTRPSHTSTERRSSYSDTDIYAIMVSCRCNYTESRLFFKQPTNWRPRISRDLLISVAPELSHRSSTNDRVSHLPVQVLTLRASNLTAEDLTLTVLAPASFTAPPSVGSLNLPSTPMGAAVGSMRKHGNKVGSKTHSRVASAPPALEQLNEGGELSGSQSSAIPDVISSTGFGCTHLWLQSRVPLGCVPANSTATIKLELLPLTDGIITLDTLQIDVKEKGLTYIPEYSLKINATSSISTGIV
ncbi:unnamed protein product [Linum tenue]|uniref:Uncharacterized protein n=1 Tax=Linum tenue TaxID=586396 RepID=A0AAV0S3F6_9ROSI|nr:unnamed protein product [Linum tenue]